MATLKRAKAGHYYTHANFGGPATIQISPKGVEYLRSRGLGLGDEIRPHLKFLYDRNWAYTRNEAPLASSFVFASADFERRKAESDLNDKPPLREMARQCLLETDSGHFAIGVVIPSVSRDWLRQANRAEMALFENPRCRVTVGGQSIAAELLRHDPAAIPIKPSPHIELTVGLAGSWPKTLDTSAITCSLDRLGEVELFADPSIGGKRLFSPRLAPKDSLYLLVRHDVEHAGDIIHDLTALNCAVEFRQRITSWNVHRLTLPSRDGDDFNEALSVIGARPALGRWRVRLLGPPVFAYDVNNRPKVHAGLPVILNIKFQDIDRSIGTQHASTLKIFLDQREQGEFPVTITSGRPCSLDLSTLPAGLWTIAVGSKQQGWDRLSFRITNPRAVRFGKADQLRVTIRTGENVVHLNGLDDPTWTRALTPDALSELGVSLHAVGPTNVSAWPSFPGGNMRLDAGTHDLRDLLQAARKRLAGAKPVSLLIDGDLYGRVFLELSPVVEARVAPTAERHKRPSKQHWHDTLERSFRRRDHRLHMSLVDGTYRAIPVAITPLLKRLERGSGEGS